MIDEKKYIKALVENQLLRANYLGFSQEAVDREVSRLKINENGDIESDATLLTYETP